MVNIQIHDLRLECELCGTIRTVTVQEQAAIIRELKSQGRAARKIISCPGACKGKVQWSLGRGTVGEAL